VNKLHHLHKVEVEKRSHYWDFLSELVRSKLNLIRKYSQVSTPAKSRGRHIEEALSLLPERASRRGRVL
jgi:hypothetical protein